VQSRLRAGSFLLFEEVRLPRKLSFGEDRFKLARSFALAFKELQLALEDNKNIDHPFSLFEQHVAAPLFQSNRIAADGAS
jgi:hypothetical protein